MQTEIASQIILAHLMDVSVDARPGSPSAATGVSLNQIKMWLVPQKAEHDSDYDINPSYFETLLRQAVGELLEKGYVVSSVRDGVEDGDPQMFSLTQKGIKYIEEELTVSHDEL